uniref:Uncharacterized protein n=1 Tax=Loa loa TaxID=7209 RepID=A0A1I7VFJ4_LOALO
MDIFRREVSSQAYKATANTNEVDELWKICYRDSLGDENISKWPKSKWTAEKVSNRSFQIKLNLLSL